jgi:hypothetical protein
LLFNLLGLEHKCCSNVGEEKERIDTLESPLSSLKFKSLKV